MPQPTPYRRQFGFTDYQANNPDSPPPGSALDTEFAAVMITFAGILANLAKIQRDDGALKNQIVTLDSLSPAVMLALGAGVIWLPRGPWVTATAYSVSDVVEQGTATFVCSAAHTSGVFADDYTAGVWVKLYDDAGITPADGSVTAAKLAIGSVTAPAIGFTGLDLSGSIRGGAGLQAGIAPAGSLMHAMTNVGDAYAKVQRKTDAQGAVGYQIIGVGYAWTLGMAAGSNVLQLGSIAMRPGGGADNAGHLRAVGASVPTTGAGCAISFASGIGYLDSFDYDAAKWRDLKVRGANVTLTASGVDGLKVTPSGAQITGSAQLNGIDMGYLDVPQNAQAGAYTVQLSDRGRHIYCTNTTGQVIVFPLNATTPFPIGTAIALVNAGAGPVSITGSGASIKLAGTTSDGTRTLATRGVATMLKTNTDEWYIVGTGVS